MKGLVILVLLAMSQTVRTNENVRRTFNAANKLFIITLDGFRWQELFGGADSTLLHRPENAAWTDLYWAPAAKERRQKLLPFFWSVLARQGQLYGNRRLQSFVNVANPYALSYPGYNELLTGSVDLTLFNNGKTPNRNATLLEELNASPAFKNKVAAFASWDAFPYILQQAKDKVFVNSGFDALPASSADDVFINQLQAEEEDQKNTRSDELTFLACKSFVQKQKPSVVFLSFGGTDEEAHKNNYTAYLQQANKADRMIGELWQYLQTLPEYRGKTTFLLTTDHGRGGSAGTWHKHGFFVGGSSQTWLALIGPTVLPLGERRQSDRLLLKDIKPLVLKLLSQ